MGFWKTPQEMGMDESQVTLKLEELWNEANSKADEHCNDCNASPGEPHMDGCDVARCTSCKDQALSCDCQDKGEDVWDGLWPGTRECYKKRLIAFGGGSWIFDYNTLATLIYKQ